MNRPESFTCECGREHLFTNTVFDNWHEVVKHRCAWCGRRHEVLEGVATEVAGADPRIFAQNERETAGGGGPTDE